VLYITIANYFCCGLSHSHLVVLIGVKINPQPSLTAPNAACI
jgi:hypothetical protein